MQVITTNECDLLPPIKYWELWDHNLGVFEMFKTKLTRKQLPAHGRTTLVRVACYDYEAWVVDRQLKKFKLEPGDNDLRKFDIDFKSWMPQKKVRKRNK